MTTASRRPCLELAPWVGRIWASAPGARNGNTSHSRHTHEVLTERVLPTGTTHVVWRDAKAPLILLSDQGHTQTLPAQMIVGGIRAAPYTKRIAEDAATVGVQLRPGGALVVLGVPAGEIAGRHTDLETIWSEDPTETMERLYARRRKREEAPPRAQQSVLADLHSRMNTLETALLARVRRLDIDQARQRWVQYCAQRLEQEVPLAQLVRETCMSHRTFITRFRSAVGLPPKVYARVRRFQRVIQAFGNPVGRGGPVSRAPHPSLARLAMDLGYSDQAHLCRNFREFTGLSPSYYLHLAPALPNHVRLGRHPEPPARLQFRSRRNPVPGPG